MNHTKPEFMTLFANLGDQERDGSNASPIALFTTH